MKPARILHVVYSMGHGGMESRIMDLYRRLDKERFQYDFYIESGEEEFFDEEIRSLGGLVYYNKRSNGLNIPNFNAFNKFLREHQGFSAVYAYNQWAGWYLKTAKMYRIGVRIASACTSLQTVTLGNCIMNIVKLNVNRYSTHRFAVSKNAARWLFGKKRLLHGDVCVWPNSIDTKKYLFSVETREKVRQELLSNDSYTVMHIGNI